MRGPHLLWLAPFCLQAVSGCGAKKSAQTTSSVPSLDGTWVTPCLGGTTGGKTVYVIKTDTFSGPAVTASFTQYSDPECTKPAGASTTQLAAVAVGGDVPGTPGAKAIDYSPTKVTTVPLDSATATAWSAAKYCGAADWVVGTAKEVTTCNSGSGALNSTRYSIFNIVNGTTLLVGQKTDALDESSPAKRPTQLNAGGALTKSPP